MRTRHLPRLALGLTLTAAALLTGCGAAPSASAPDPTAPAPPTAAPTCPESGVLIRTGPDYAAMGLCMMTVEPVNCGTRPCTVNGRPAVRILDAAARQTLDVEVRHGASPIAAIDGLDAASELVTLRPNKTAVASLVWRNTVTLSTVPAADGRYLVSGHRPGRRWPPTWTSVTPAGWE